MNEQQLESYRELRRIALGYEFLRARYLAIRQDALAYVAITTAQIEDMDRNALRVQLALRDLEDEDVEVR